MNTYDRFVSQFRPTSLLVKSSYFDFLLKSSPYFDADRTFFVVHPKRKSFIRTAFCGEFDYTPDDQPCSELLPEMRHLNNIGMPDDVIRRVWRHIPRLHILVTRITPDLHHVTVILRGDCFWPVSDEEGRNVDQLRTDADLAPILARIATMEGFDVAAWQRFERALTVATEKLISSGPISERVH